MKQLKFVFVKQLPDGSAAISSEKVFTVGPNQTFDLGAMTREFTKFAESLEVDGDISRQAAPAPEKPKLVVDNTKKDPK